MVFAPPLPAPAVLRWLVLPALRQRALKALLLIAPAHYGVAPLVAVVALVEIVRLRIDARITIA